MRMKGFLAELNYIVLNQRDSGFGQTIHLG